MHDFAKIAPEWCIAHHDDPIATGEDILRHGEFGSSAVQLSAPVEQFTHHAVIVDKDPSAGTELESEPATGRGKESC